jgi:hypothetical protein
VSPEQWSFAAATALKPLAMLVLFALVVYPLRNLIAKAIPDGKIKRFLYRERTRENATTKDKVIMTAAVIAFYVVFFGGMLYYLTAS